MCAGTKLLLAKYENDAKVKQREIERELEKKKGFFKFKVKCPDGMEFEFEFEGYDGQFIKRYLKFARKVETNQPQRQQVCERVERDYNRKNPSSVR